MQSGRRIRILLLSLFFLPGCASVQTEPAAPAPAAFSKVLSVNVGSIVELWPGVEFEHRISAEATLGARTDRLVVEQTEPEQEEDRFTNLRAFIRYYPTRAFTGFYFDVSSGVTDADDEEDGEIEEYTAYGAGFSAGYGWLAGKRRNIAIGLGLGLDRLFGGTLGNRRKVIPSIRLNIGLAF